MPCIGRQILNHCATREALYCVLYTIILFNLYSSLEIGIAASHLTEEELKFWEVKEPTKSLSNEDALQIQLFYLSAVPESSDITCLGDTASKTIRNGLSLI